MDQQNVIPDAIQQQSAERNPNLPAAANQIPPIGQSSPPIFKLDVDCLDELFDYLSIEEVHSFGRTCKAFQKVTGKYFQWKYSAFSISCYSRPYEFIHNAGYIPDFIQFTKFIEFDEYHNIDRNFLLNCKALKHTCFMEFDVTQPFIKLLKPILPNLESFDIHECDIDGDIYEDLLKHCVQLKSLKIYHNFHEECLSQKFPALEQIQLTTCESFQNDELNKFFKLNPTVRHFATNAQTIWINRDSLLESGINLDDLIIENDYNVNKKAFYDLLNDLYVRRFYKRLHLRSYESPSEEQLYTLYGLVTLYVSESLKLPPLTHLKELRFDVNLTRLRHEELNIHEIPNLCINLERLAIDVASVHHIMPFILYSANLREISVEYFTEPVLDIAALNSQRDKLMGARKVIIYVKEDIYLATRWASAEVSLSLVEIRRHYSHEPKQSHRLRSILGL